MFFNLPVFLQFVVVIVAGWVNRRQADVIDYLREENRVLREQLKGRRIRFTDEQRRRLAEKARRLGRAVLTDLEPIVTLDTLLRWYRRLIAVKYDGSGMRKRVGRPPISDELRRLVIRIARENRTWGYERIQGALKNLGYTISPASVANILAEVGLDPAPRHDMVAVHQVTLGIARCGGFLHRRSLPRLQIDSLFRAVRDRPADAKCRNPRRRPRS